VKYIYTIKDGFQVEMNDNGHIVDAGENLVSMIQYTYFNEEAKVPDGWSIESNQLTKDYFTKYWGNNIKT